MIYTNAAEFVNPVISIIIPYYKHQSFIERCLNSVVAQSYKELEVIIIDDCSPDRSGKYVEELVRQDKYQSRFSGRLIFKQFEENQGAHSTINHGIQIASGSIISIINSDDMYHPDRFQILIEEMQKHRAEFVFSSIKYIDENDNDVTNSNETAISFVRLQETISNFPTVGFACLNSNMAISSGNFVFTKSLWERIGKFNSYRYCHDWDFLLRVIPEAEPLFVNQDLYYYRFHGTNTFSSVQHLAIQESSSILRHYFNRVSLATTKNTLAPSSFNWPHYFEMFLNLWNKGELYRLANYA